MRLGSGWDTRDNRRSRREGQDRQSPTHLRQTRPHARQADAFAFLGSMRPVQNADAIVRNDEMGGEAAEAKQQMHSGCTRMAMNVGQGLLGEPVNRRFGALRHRFRISPDVEGHFEPCAAPKSFDQ